MLSCNGFGNYYLYSFSRPLGVTKGFRNENKEVEFKKNSVSVDRDLTDQKTKTGNQGVRSNE